MRGVSSVFGTIACVMGAFSLLSCASNLFPTTVVLSYADFGPQAASWELIGKEWPQCQNIGDCDGAETCEIRVVVYRGIKRVDVQKKFPSDRALNRDYRYVEYNQAIAYLDDLVASSGIPDVSEAAAKTRSRIIRAFGN